MLKKKKMSNLAPLGLHFGPFPSSSASSSKRVQLSVESNQRIAWVLHYFTQLLEICQRVRSL